MDYAAEIAKQGFGYVLFVGALVVLLPYIRSLNKKIDDLQDKRMTDSNQYTASFTEVAKEMVAANKDSANASALMQRSIDTITQILSNVVHDRKKE